MLCHTVMDYVTVQLIILILAALCSRCGHYIFILRFLLLYVFFFPGLISEVAGWMSTILLHMMWPYCKFRIQVWNVLHAARWKYRTQKIAKNLPIGHHRTTLSGCIFATKACIDNRKTVSPAHAPQYGELQPLVDGWDRFRSLWNPSKFQWVSRLAFVTAATSLIGDQPNFARRLAVSWAGTLHIHFWGLWNFARCKTDYVQVLRSYILAALLHVTPAAGVSQTLRVVQGIELLKFRRRCHLYSAGQPSHWASAHILVLR